MLRKLPTYEQPEVPATRIAVAEDQH